MAESLQVGDRVRTRAEDHTGHSRLPHYIRGHEGTIVALDGVAFLPDAFIAGHHEQPEPVYAVRFDARELWGAGTHTVTIELWRSYLEA